MGRQLNPRQAKFVSEYAHHGNAAKAARDAGYAAKSARVAGCRLLTKDNVQAEIAAERRRYEAESRITRERVIAEIEGVIDTARARGDVRAMISGWREISRMCGYYDQRPEPQTYSTEFARRTVHRLEGMPDQELLALIAEKSLEADSQGV